MSSHELAVIMQGEAAILGLPGMFAIGLCVMSRLALHQTTDNFYGRAAPGPDAILMAGVFKSLPSWLWIDVFGAYPYCLSRQDVEKLRAPPGDVVIGRGKYQIHLFERWPG